MARVLVVDDERTTVEMLSKALSLFGHEALMALNGHQALAILAQERLDAVLLDLMMPGIDGYETLRRLRSMPQGDGLPVIVVTASQEVDLEERVRMAGGDATLRKPVDIGNLMNTIEEYVQND